MTNYRALMQEAREVNKANRVKSIPAKKYGRHSRVEAKRYTTNNVSVSTTAWEEATDAETSYEEMEAAFWS